MSDRFKPSTENSEELRIHVAGLTDVGQRRKHNEDSILVRVDLGLFLVADGMGGHLGGDVASALAASTIEEFFEDTQERWSPLPPPPAHRDLDAGGLRLMEAIKTANTRVVVAALENEARKGMGTTVVAAHLTADGTIRIGHVGDSRCYRISNGEIEQITQDHSFVNDVRWSQPDLDDDVVKGIPKNIITRALGTKEHVDVEGRSEVTLPGDTYLLCSDGLSGMISSKHMLRVVESIEDPAAACEELIARANAAGGKDNVSVILIHIDEREDTLPNAKSPVIEPDGAPLKFDTATGLWRCAKCAHEHVAGTSFCVDCGSPFLPSVK